jgi:hypothetical protein
VGIAGAGIAASRVRTDADGCADLLTGETLLPLVVAAITVFAAVAIVLTRRRRDVWGNRVPVRAQFDRLGLALIVAGFYIGLGLLLLLLANPAVYCND